MGRVATGVEDEKICGGVCGLYGTAFDSGRGGIALNVCPRTFRRYMARYAENGLEGLKDRRLQGTSAKRAPVDEVMELTEKYKSRHQGWAVKPFYSWYK
jgi:hypothetical protein